MRSALMQPPGPRQGRLFLDLGPERAEIFLDQTMEEAGVYPIASGTSVILSDRSPDKQTPNEDAAAIMRMGRTEGVLVIADGAGGQPAGDQAAARAIHSLHASLDAGLKAKKPIREAILDGFEQANQRVLALGNGAATTLLAVEIHGNELRSYHVGDSLALVTGQRGKLKMHTSSHSPVGYALQAGVLDEGEALHHDELHVVSNLVGSIDMRIEVSSTMQLDPLDTVVLASDGLYDNLHTHEIVELVRKGPLVRAMETITSRCRARMQAQDAGHPSKPDDVTIILFRPGKNRVPAHPGL